MKYFTFGYRMPRFFSAPLFGDRQRFGLTVKEGDACWEEWSKRYLDFYYNTQKQSVGEIVNNAGYKVLSQIDLAGKNVLEIGPGDIPHLKFWKGSPGHYTIADTKQRMLDRSGLKLKETGVLYTPILMDEASATALPFNDEEYDIIISFYAFEHILPFSEYLNNLLKCLKKGGKLVGGIPCEGGFAWGLGRLFTSRRWLKRNTEINPDKIICWEHPNYAETILKELDNAMNQRYINYWPLTVPSIDMNLVVRFVYEKQ